MKTALSDFIYVKKGIYGILHVFILLLSLFLIIIISIDTPFVNTYFQKNLQFFEILNLFT